MSDEEIEASIDDEAANRADRLAGTRCFCCDAPLPASLIIAGATECAECAEIEV